MLAFDDMAAPRQGLGGFRADQDLKLFEESERDGPLVSRIQNTIMRPTAYSPMQ